MYYGMSRGSGKIVSSYFALLKQLHDSGKISWKDYIEMVEFARVTLFGEPEDEVLKWMEEKMSEENNDR